MYPKKVIGMLEINMFEASMSASVFRWDFDLFCSRKVGWYDSGQNQPFFSRIDWILDTQGHFLTYDRYPNLLKLDGAEYVEVAPKYNRR